jgi:predicted Zn finger-like uncharacterized protein
MPIKAMCPECQTQYSVPDTAAGKKVKCKTCEFVFPIPGQKTAAARPAPKDPWETDDSEDDIPLLTPAKKTKPKASDGLPPKIVKPKKKSTYIADDDDEEDEPKPKKKKKRQQSSEMDPRLMFLAIALGIVVLAGVAGFFEPQVTLWVGIIAIAGGGLWQLAMAFEEDDFTGWLHMKVPGYSLYFAITRISETWPAILVQFLGLVLCVSYVALENRQNGGLFVRALNNIKDADIEDIDDPEDIPLIKAARPFADAISTGNHEAAFAELSPLALANAYRDQFVPPDDNEKQRTSIAPLTIESFKEQMAESEKVLGKPKKIEHMYVDSRDPEVLSGRGDAIERMLVMGGTPDGVTASARRACLHVRIDVKHPDFPDESEDGDGPYLNMRVIVTEEDGELRVGYFELRPPSILD